MHRNRNPQARRNIVLEDILKKQQDAIEARRGRGIKPHEGRDGREDSLLVEAYGLPPLIKGNKGSVHHSEMKLPPLPSKKIDGSMQDGQRRVRELTKAYNVDLLLDKYRVKKGL